MNIYMAGESGETHDVRAQLIADSDVILAYQRADSETIAECAVALHLAKPFVVATDRARFPGILAQYATVIFHPIREREQAIYLTTMTVPFVSAGDRLFIAVANNLERAMELVESPIEQRLAVYLAASGIEVEAQHELEIEGRKCRIDFAIPSIKIAIEVDGHDFHERTKEQAQRDKARDRALQILGWKPLRFTGSEVFRDAATCAGEVLRIMGTAQ
jgi:very-short-patch-repair endonuclease